MIVLQRARSAAFARALTDAEHGAQAPTTEHLRGLVALARALPCPEVGMPPDERDRMRRRLVAMASVAAMAPPEPPSDARRKRSAGIDGSWASRRVAVVASVVMVLLTVLGVGSAAGRSLPGDPLYRVKLAAERVQLATTFGKVPHGERHFDLASERLVEVQKLLDRERLGALAPAARRGMPLAAGRSLASTPPQVWNALGDMSRHTVAGTKDLMAAWQTSGDQRPLKLITRHAEDQWRGVEATVPELPVGDRRAAAKPLGVLLWVTSRAEQLQSVKACDADCRAGRTSAAGPHVTVDALGLPCVIKCGVENPLSAVGPRQSASESQAASMSATLTRLLTALPSAQDSNPVPGPMLSLPAVVPVPTLGSSAATSGGTPTATASPNQPAPTIRVDPPTQETPRTPSSPTETVQPTPSSPPAEASPDHTVPPPPTPSTSAPAPTPSPSTPAPDPTAATSAAAPEPSAVPSPSDSPSPTSQASGGAAAAGDVQLSDSGSPAASEPPSAPAQPAASPAAEPSASPSA